MLAKKGFMQGMNPTTSLLSAGIVLLFIVLSFAAPQTTASAVFGLSGWILETLTWYYIAIVAFFLGFLVWLAFSRYGNIRLGADDEKPEFSNFAWFAMLFSGGMGIGLIFWSIAEPIYHFQSNPFIDQGLTPEAAQMAMRLTFFDWGLNTWATFVIVGLAMAYFSYRKGMPLTIRSALYPIFGERIHGPLGHAVDILAIFATLFGIATSLGLGAAQMTSGIYHLTGIGFFAEPVVDAAGQMVLLADGSPKLGPSLVAELVIIAIVTAIATLSVASGVKRGVKWLSEINLWLTFAILGFLIAFGPTKFLLHLLLEANGDYLANLIPLSLWTDSVRDSQWQAAWTAFYWAWFISWAPFVGMFIARISRGRTIREFILGVLVAPTFFGFVWITLFGGTALHIELTHTVMEAGQTVAAIGQAGIVEAVNNDVTLALYTTFEKMDLGMLGTLAMILATILIATYFITSSDSGTLVVTTILADGQLHPPVRHRIVWGVAEGCVAAALLLAGGLKAIQTASITAALPFSIVMLLMVWGLMRALGQEQVGVVNLRPVSQGD